jgi:hypothetical protein
LAEVWKRVFEENGRPAHRDLAALGRKDIDVANKDNAINMKFALEVIR